MFIDFFAGLDGLVYEGQGRVSIGIFAFERCYIFTGPSRATTQQAGVLDNRDIIRLCFFLSAYFFIMSIAVAGLCHPPTKKNEEPGYLYGWIYWGFYPGEGDGPCAEQS